MTKNERLKEVIAAIKYRHKITQKDIAEQIGLRSTTYLSDLIRGKSEVTDSVSDKLWKVFHINKAYILEGGQEMWEDDFQKEINKNNSDIISMPADVWAVISNQAESLKMKDEQINDVLASLKSKDKQVEEVIELLKDQLKKGQDVENSFRVANLVVVEDE